MMTAPFAAEVARRHMERSIASTRLAMRRGLSVLAGIAYTAPLLGFLGAYFVAADRLRCWAGPLSLSEIPIPIGVSLIIALPVFWVYRYLCARVDEYETEMKIAAAELMHALERT